MAFSFIWLVIGYVASLANFISKRSWKHFFHSALGILVKSTNGQNLTFCSRMHRLGNTLWFNILGLPKAHPTYCRSIYCSVCCASCNMCNWSNVALTYNTCVDSIFLWASNNSNKKTILGHYSWLSKSCSPGNWGTIASSDKENRQGKREWNEPGRKAA